MNLSVSFLVIAFVMSGPRISRAEKRASDVDSTISVKRKSILEPSEYRVSFGQHRVTLDK